MKVQLVATDKLKPYGRNPRKRSPESVRKIADSIEAFGWQQPIVVDKDFVVIIGHGRLEAAKLMGQAKVPVQVTTDLTPEQVKALRLADNKLNQGSDWEPQLLLSEIEELRKLEVDLATTGFAEDDLKRLADDIDELALERIAGAPGGEEPFTADQEGQDSAGGDDVGAGSRDSDEALVTLSEVLTLQQRNVVNAAIKLAKERERLERRGDALFHICEQYLEDTDA
jgi:ParB-like chromosome segregation protein Spo0J